MRRSVTLPSDGEPFELRLAFDDAFERCGSEVTLVGQVVGRGGEHAVRFSLPGDGDGRALAELAAGEWSERLELPLAVDGETVPGLFRLKLQELDPGAGLFRLYVTDICRRTWLEQPAGALGDTSCFAGLPTPGVGWDSLGLGCIDIDTFVDLTGMATAWLGDVCAALLTERPWHLFCVHLHAIDSFYHLCSAKLDERADAGFRPSVGATRRPRAPSTASSTTPSGGCWRRPTLCAHGLVSDHGAKPAGERVPLRRHPGRRGPAGRAEGGDAGGDAGQASTGSRRWPRRRGAAMCASTSPAANRRASSRRAGSRTSARRAMRAMLDYRDARTGECPFSLVVPSEEAVDLGLYGDGVGDVVYAVREEFADEHGQMLPQDDPRRGGVGHAFALPVLRARDQAGERHRGAGLAHWTSRRRYAPRSASPPRCRPTADHSAHSSRMGRSRPRFGLPARTLGRRGPDDLSFTLTKEEQ